MTEGLKAVEDGNNPDEDNEEEEDGDYLDEYGNIKENVTPTTIAATVKKNLKTEKGKSQDEDDSKGKKKNERQTNKSSQKGNTSWRDLDSADNSEDTKKRKDSKTEYVKSSVDIDMKAAGKLMFPRESSLSWTEQEKFLFNEKLFKEGRLGPGNGNQWQFFQNFKELVMEEQEEFAQFIKVHFSPVVHNLCEGHKKYVEDHRSARLARVSALPRHWEKTKQVRMIGVSEEQSCAMILEQTLLELGDRPEAKIPDLISSRGREASMKLPTQYLKLINHVPADPVIVPGSYDVGRATRDPRRPGSGSSSETWSAQSSVQVDHNKHYHKQSCIDDHNCALLAQHLVPDIIISSSAIKCIFDNHRRGAGKTWEIPVVVRTFISEVDERKVVVFGKPLPAREMTSEDANILAHKVAVQVGLFKHNWEVKARPKSAQERVSPTDDLFGDATESLADLEVFGTDTTNTKQQEQPEEEPANDDPEQMDVEDQDVLLQVDGGDDSDSEDEDNLVISDQISPPRRSSRLRQKSCSSVKSSASSTKSPEKSAANRRKVAASTASPLDKLDEALDELDEPAVEETKPSSVQEDELPPLVAKPVVDEEMENLDFEPEESSSSESECEDVKAAQLLFKEKFSKNLQASQSMSKADLSFDKPPADTKSTADSEDSDSSSSDEGGAVGGDLLLQKKMLMMKNNANAKVNVESPMIDSTVQGSQKIESESQKASKTSPGVSNEEKLTVNESNDDSSSASEEDDDGEELMKKKMQLLFQTKQEKSEASSSSKLETDTVRKEDDVEEAEAVISPKKQLRKLSSDSSDDEEDKMKAVQNKLKHLGRENVDLSQLKKIETTRNLSSLAEKQEQKAESQRQSRRSRAVKRGQDKSLFGSDDTEESADSTQQSSPKKRIVKRGDLSSSDDEDDEKRFNKFSNSSSSSRPAADVLGNLLTGQNKLLHSEHRKYSSLPPPAAHVSAPSLDQSVKISAPGLPPVDQFKSPISGANVSYRMWKLYDKSRPGSRQLRVVVRSKISGVTRSGTVVTPSVKMEHQPAYGAEQVSHII